MIVTERTEYNNLPDKWKSQILQFWINNLNELSNHRYNMNRKEDADAVWQAVNDHLYYVERDEYGLEDWDWDWKY